MEISLRHSLLDRVCFGVLPETWRAGWAGVAPPTPVSSVRSPLEFHGDLHAAPGVRLRAPEAEVGVLQRAAPAQRAKLGPVQQVEGLPSEVQVLLLLQRNAPRQGDALAEARPVAQFGVVSRHRAQRVRRLGAEERS